MHVLYGPYGYEIQVSYLILSDLIFVYKVESRLLEVIFFFNPLSFGSVSIALKQILTVVWCSVVNCVGGQIPCNNDWYIRPCWYDVDILAFPPFGSFQNSRNLKISSREFITPQCVSRSILF